MLRLYTRNLNLKNSNLIIINIVKFLVNAFKCYSYRIDSILFKDGIYLVTFFYVARRQPFIKPVTDIYKNLDVLKMFRSSEVALISYLHTTTKYNNMKINKSNIFNG